MNNIELKLDKKGQGYAKIYSSLLKDEFQRKRSYAGLCALYAFLDYIEEKSYNISIQKAMTLFRNPALNEEFEFSDVYINGKCVDFRVYAEGDAVLLPKVQADNGILPDYYAVVKVDKNLSSFVLQGFLDTDNLKTEVFDYYYNSAELSQLISLADFILDIQKAEPYEFDSSEHFIFNEEYLRLIDNEIDKDKKIELVKHLIKCEDCRREFCCFTGFEMVSINTGKYPELIDDKTLDIIGAQAVEKGEYNGKEEIISIVDEPETEETADNTEIPVENVPDSAQEDALETAGEDIPVPLDDLTDNYDIIEEDVKESDSKSDNSSDAAGLAGIAAISAGGAAIAGVTASIASDAVEAGLADIAEMSDDDILDADFSDIIPLQEVDDTISENVTAQEPTAKEELMPVENFATDISSDGAADETAANADDTDILDELFNIEETLPEYAPDDSQNSLKIDDDDTNNNVIILKSDDEDDSISLDDEADIKSDESDVQKVIIDYDDDGNPVYSYVTTIDDDDNSDGDISVEDTAEDDITVDEEEDNKLLDDLDDNLELDENVEETGDDSEILHEDNEEPDFIEETDEAPLSESENEINPVVAGGAVAAGIAGVSAASAEADEIPAGDVSEDNLLSADDFTSDDSDTDSHFSESMYDSQVESFVNENNDEDDSESDDIFKEDDFEENDDSEDSDEYEDSDEDDEDGEDEDSEEYDEEDGDEEYDYEGETETGKNNSKSMIAAIIAVIVLLIGAAGAGVYFFMNKNANNVASSNLPVIEQPQDNPEQNGMMPPGDNGNDMFEGQPEMPQDNPPADQPQPENNDVQTPPLTEQDLVNQNAPLTQDSNKAIANAFSSGSSPVSLNGISWLGANSLWTNKYFKDYLHNLDNNLRDKLKNNLMNASELATNKVVKVDLVVNNNGELEQKNVSSSSGSQQIDHIVLQSINECFDGSKTDIIPEGDGKSDKYNFTVVLKF